MKENIPYEVLSAFTGDTGNSPDVPANVQVHELTGGLINYSYRISCGQHPDFLLQQINKNVFVCPTQVQENYLAIWQYAANGQTGLRIPTPKLLGSLYIDQQGNYWRAFEFVDNTAMYRVAENIEQVKATAKAFAGFITAFDQFDVGLLQEVIPGFHDLGLRYEQFEASLDNDHYERIARAMPLINQLKAREHYKQFYQVIIESGEFPLRVMHHDAKIGNVLFCSQTGDVRCIVDLDTVMPGYFFSDLGDMVRSMISTADESCTDPAAITVRKDFYDAILDSYLDVAGDHLNEAEKKYIHYAGILVIYMQALRFLTDYLEGDIYYHTDYAEHNFDRARNQLLVLQQLEQLLETHYTFMHD